ncbi:hypothetical protein T265_04503 [Opisthorchis viverrini]|uniref:Uncharacterized protein n=1 Tax=Opisthorchis viverrini TaxID=6198 RepID=A0A075AGH2_OPIVI|nr:hypothetical protein T265_04503 [Opisthorchis viverrini]KER28714.1 hypothetical protein T265_04503 [Opisthorchis viverrini]
MAWVYIMPPENRNPMTVVPDDPYPSMAPKQLPACMRLSTDEPGPQFASKQLHRHLGLCEDTQNNYFRLVYNESKWHHYCQGTNFQKVSSKQTAYKGVEGLAAGIHGVPL